MHAARVVSGLGLHEVDPRVADKVRDVEVAGVVVHLERRRDLDDDALAEDRDLGGHGQGLGLVVGDVDHGCPGLNVQAFELAAHVHAELGVQVGQRLVEQEQMRFGSDRAGDCDALLLAAGQLGWIAIDILRNLHALKRGLDAVFDLGLGQLLDLESELDILAHGHVRPQGVGLEHEVEPALARRGKVCFRRVDNLLAVDVDGAILRFLQAGYHAQGGRLAAARRAKQRHKVAVLNGQVNILEDMIFAIEFINVFQFNLAHSRFAPSLSVSLAYCFCFPSQISRPCSWPGRRRQRYLRSRRPGIRWRT